MALANHKNTKEAAIWPVVESCDAETPERGEIDKPLGDDSMRIEKPLGGNGSPIVDLPEENLPSHEDKIPNLNENWIPDLELWEDPGFFPFGGRMRGLGEEMREGAGDLTMELHVVCSPVFQVNSGRAGAVSCWQHY